MSRFYNFILNIHSSLFIWSEMMHVVPKKWKSFYLVWLRISNSRSGNTPLPIYPSLGHSWLLHRYLSSYRRNVHIVVTNFGMSVKRKGIELGSNRSNMRKSVSSDFQTPRSRLEKRGAADFFLTNFEVFGNRRKHSFECLI